MTMKEEIMHHCEQDEIDFKKRAWCWFSVEGTLFLCLYLRESAIWYELGRKKCFSLWLARSSLTGAALELEDSCSAKTQIDANPSSPPAA